MPGRLDYYFRQKVTEAELDLGFELLEKADDNLAAVARAHGDVSRAVAEAATPERGLTIELSAPPSLWPPRRCVFSGTGQTVNLAVASTRIAADV